MVRPDESDGWLEQFHQRGARDWVPFVLCVLLACLSWYGAYRLLSYCLGGGECRSGWFDRGGVWALAGALIMLGVAIVTIGYRERPQR